jgi:hypothetical protein
MAGASARAPRSTPRLIGETFQLYRRYPLLFLVLAAGVVVPYRLIVLAATGSVPHHGHLAGGTALLLLLIDTALVDPLVSALHVHAVEEVEEGRTPQFGPVARRGLAALPVVAAAVIMSWLAFFGGLFLLILPGIYIFFRLRVTAQVAAIERQSWLSALRRSWALTEGNLRHVFFFVICIGLITALPGMLIDRALADAPAVVTFSGWLVVQILVISFAALATALLYFDLRSRRRYAAEQFLEMSGPS